MPWQIEATSLSRAWNSWNHVEDGQVAPAKAPTLKHHTGDAGLLVGIDELPALLERYGRRYLDADVLAGLHAVDGHGVCHSHGVAISTASRSSLVMRALKASSPWAYSSASGRPARVTIWEANRFESRK